MHPLLVLASGLFVAWAVTLLWRERWAAPAARFSSLLLAGALIALVLGVIAVVAGS